MSTWGELLPGSVTRNVDLEYKPLNVSASLVVKEGSGLPACSSGWGGVAVG